jgi:filamin
VDGNLKLILGLIWTLILHYQISMGFQTDDDTDKKGGPSPKQQLMAWIQEKLPDKNIKNFNTDWNNGVNVAALVNAVAPGLCPEHADMDGSTPLENAQLAMGRAEEWLGVPQVLAPQDMVNPNVDELSMMTYLSYFPEATPKPGAPVFSRTNVSKVYARGPGLEKTGLKEGMRGVFTVFTKGAGPGDVEVKVTGPGGEDFPCNVVDNGDTTYTCEYTPSKAGPFKVEVLYGGQQIPKSPFEVSVATIADPTKCKAWGPGVEGTGLKEGQPAEFWVQTKDAGPGELEISVRGPKGILQADELTVTPEEEGTYHCVYHPERPGEYQVYVRFGYQHIPQSPFTVRVSADVADASKCRAEGPGVEGTGLVVGEPAVFWVHTADAGRGKLDVSVRGRYGTLEPEIADEGNGTYKVTYHPEKDGEYTVAVRWGSGHVPGSRFKVNVDMPTDASKCKAQGPGLNPAGVRCGAPAKFSVRTKGAGPGELQVKAVNEKTNTEAPVEMKEGRDGTYAVTYSPEEPGPYLVSVTYAGDDIPDSPFSVPITDPSKVTVSGRGIGEDEIVKVGEPLEFAVDATQAGPGDLTAQLIVGTRGKPEDIPVEDNGDGTFCVKVTPEVAQRHNINLLYAGGQIPDSPLKLHVADPAQVKVYGRGLEDGLKVGDAAPFTVDLNKAGEGDLGIEIDGPVEVGAERKQNRDKTWTVTYFPTEPGEYQVHLTFAGDELPDSPFLVNVEQATSPDKVKASGPGLEKNGLVTGSPADFIVDTSEAGPGELSISVQGPDGAENVDVAEDADGTTFSCGYNPQTAGDYIVNIKYAGKHIPNSPFRPRVRWATDSTKVKAYGPGLKSGLTDEPAEFTVDTSKAGDAGLAILVEGPSQAEMKVDDKGDGTCLVQYFPTLAGEYRVNIKFDEEHIPGSPFTSYIEPATDAAKVHAEGPGLQPTGLKVGDPGDFLIDTTEAGRGNLRVTVDGPKRNAATVKVDDNGDGTYNARYDPKAVGQYKVKIQFADQDIRFSPFDVAVCDPSKVVVTGPGLSEKEEPLMIREMLEYKVNAQQAGPGELAAMSITTGGKQTPLDVLDNKDGTYTVQFYPEEPGAHALDLRYSGHEIPQSPLTLGIADPSGVKVSGEGLNGGKVNEKQTFQIDTREAGHGGLSLAIEGPSKAEIQCDDNGDGTCTISYTPNEAGEYKVKVQFADETIPGSPFCIPITDVTQVQADGPGLTGEGVAAGEPAEFDVNTARAGPLDYPIQCTVTNPDGTEIADLTITPDDKGNHHVTYETAEPGMYKVNLVFADEQVPDFPVEVPIADPSRCRLSGPGLQAGAVKQPGTFEVNKEEAGPGEVGVQIVGPYGPGTGVESLDIVDKGDGTVAVTYVPVDAGEYTIEVTYAGMPVSDQAYVVPVADPSACKAYGPGLEPIGLFADKMTNFTVETVGAGSGDLEVAIFNQKSNEPVNYTLSEKSDGVYYVEYVPPDAAIYQADIKFAEQQASGSPFVISVCDPTKVKAYGAGLEAECEVNQPASFTIDTREAGEGNISLAVEGPSKAEIECNDKGDGTCEVTYYPTLDGRYEVVIKFAEVLIPNSPFTVRIVRPPPDASKVEVSGAGLEFPKVGQLNSFVVDASAAGGRGMLEVGVFGAYVPAEEVNIKHTGNYVFDIGYDIREPGETVIYVKWHGEHVPGSPFTVVVEE